MKRFLALFLALIMLLAMFASCQPKTPQETTPEETTPEATTPEETTPAGNDPIIPPTNKMAGEIVGELNPTQLFATNTECNEAIFANLESPDAILGAFKAEGYTQVTADAVEGAKIQTVLLTKGAELVTLYWIPSEKEARVIWEEVDAAALLPLQKTEITGGGTLTMVQIGVERVSETDNPNIGMCYIFKLSNGNALIIDGGFSNEKCGENVYNALAKLDIAKNEEGKYVIEAWIFTHVHGDHSGVVYPFSEQYANKVAVSYVLYQIPTNEELSADVGKAGAYGEVSFFETAAKAFPGAVVLNPHVGLNYYFGNATVSMLYTPDVIWNLESKLDYYNNNSMIFKVSGGETAFLCMGDAGDAAAARAWSLFDAFSFESGIFQLSHHGMSTGAGDKAWTWDNLKKIYEATGATTVALPLGTRIEDPNDFKAYNGRWNILFDYPYNKNNQMSYIVRKGDAPTSNGYFNRELLNRLVATAETGHNYLVEMSVAYGGVRSLHGYNGINMIDNGAGIITYISCADHDEMATTFLFANGEITVKKNEKLDEWLKLPEHNTNDVIVSINPAAKPFESTFGTQEVVLTGISSKASIIAAFTTRGFEAVEVNMVEGAKFETLLFTNGMELATVYFKPDQNEARILFEKLDENALAALQKNETTGLGELTFVQIGVERVNEPDNPMIGLCYIVKLSNGNAIVIDGGANNEKCAENIYNTLSKLNVARNAKGQYIVEAWIFTHGHSDHNGVMNAFAEKYAKKVNVLNFLYQIPSNGEISAIGAGVAGEEAFHELCRKTYPNANYINPKVGLNYYFGNATVSMFYTPDVMWSLENKITYYNDTSLIFGVRGGGTGFLCFGDAGEAAAAMAWSLFEESAFKNGLLQITHHGLTTQEGATGNVWEYIGKIYEATGANLVVLPMGETNEKDNRNGRYSVLFQYPHSGYHMSFVVNKDNAPFSSKYFNADVFNCFISDVETGSNLMETKYNLGSYKTLYGYNGINMIDNGAGRITYISSRDKTPMVTVFSFADGKVSVVENRDLYEWLAEPTKIDEFDSTFNSEMEIYTNVNSVELFTAPLVADGYKILDVTMIEGAKFETILLQKGTSLVTLYWFEESRDLRVAYDTIQETATAPLTPNAETGKGEVIVAQVGVDVKDPGNQSSTENNPNIGLCYIFKLSNGHAIIIDGGFYYQSNADNIYKSLVSLDIAKDANGKYVVEAWIFTHGHGDHNGATAFFFPSYSSKVDVKNFVYQLPINKEISPTGAGYAGEAAFHELCTTTYPNANYINPRAGLTYYFGNAEVDMFHTPDIIWCHTDPIPDYNDSGIIFRVTGGGVEGVLFMGDSGEHPSTATVKNYDVSAFNSNIVQISHHGLNTQVNEGHEWRNMKVIYEGATAEYAFLPMGIAKPNVRSGRWSVLCGWGYTGKQASFVINAEDDARGVDQTAWNTFVAGILDGSLEGETLLGYNGHNIVDNGQGRITYIHSSETDPMVTIMTFKDGKITVDLNDELYDWFAANK